MKKKRHYKYNVWKTPYKNAFNLAKEYAEIYEDVPGVKFDLPFSDAPTLEDIEDVRRLHELNKQTVREFRKTSIYQKACEAIDKMILAAYANIGVKWPEWEKAKVDHADKIAAEEKAIHSNDDTWGQMILDNIGDLKNDLMKYAFQSKQTWDFNTPHESTEWWDSFEKILMGN